MTIRFNITLLLLVSVLAACSDQNYSEFTDTPIIESYLRPGDYLNLQVSRQIPFSSDVQYSSGYINKLIINVTYKCRVYTLKSLGEGKYIDSSLIVSAGETYDLSFKYNSRNVTAYTEIPSKPVNFIQSD